MQITYIGWILIPLSAFFYWVESEYLYFLAVFFLPFSATAIVNIGSADSASGVQVSMLFGSLWILRELFSFREHQYASLQQLLTPVRRLGMFLLVASISLLVPLWIGGQLVIESPELG